VNTQCDLALTDYDPPTKAEMDARTLLAANYFDPATDTVATVTNLTNLPSIPANWITAAGITNNAFTAAKFNAGALNGKGDWNIGKTGYSVSGTITTLDGLNNVAATDIVSAGAITTLAGAVVNVDTVDTTTTNTDMRGTNGANTVVPDAAGVAPTAAEIRAEMDANSVDLNTLITGVNVTQIAGNTEAATDLAASAATIVTGAATATTLTTTTMSTNLTEATDSHYNGRIIIWTSGVLKDQATNITAYTGSTKLLTFTAVTSAPSNTDTFVIV